MDKVSIIMAAYNAEKTVGQAISSVCAQTYGNFELIVVDDGSGDGTAALVRSFADRDTRIRLLTNETNLGVSASRFRALEAAEGAWIAILDSDDAWVPDKLEKQMALQRRTSGDIFFTGSAFMDPEGQKIPYYLPAPERVGYRRLLRQNVMSNSSVLIRKELYRENYSHGDAMHEDYATWLRALRPGRIAYGIDEPLLIYRLSEGSKTGNKKKAAVMNWNTYREIGLGPAARLYYMAWYTFNGVRKYAHLRSARKRMSRRGAAE